MKISRMFSPAFVFFYLILLFLLSSYMKGGEPKYPQIISSKFDTYYKTGEFSTLRYDVVIQGVSKPYEMILETSFYNKSKIKLISYKKIVNIKQDSTQVFKDIKMIKTDLADEFVYMGATLTLFKKKY